jgi:hypothetical protein
MGFLGSFSCLDHEEEAEESNNESDEEEAEESHAEEESDEEESDDEEESESDEEESDEEHESNEEEESDSSDDRRGNSSTKRVVWSDRIKSVKKIEYGEDELMWKQEAWGEIKARKEENKQGRKEEEKIKKCQTKRLNVYAAPLSVPPSLPFLSLSLLAFPPMDYDYVDPTIFSPSLPLSFSPSPAVEITEKTEMDVIEPNQNDGSAEEEKREASRRAAGALNEANDEGATPLMQARDRSCDLEWSDAEDLQHTVALLRHRGKGAVARAGRVKMQPREVKERQRDRRSRGDRRRSERHKKTRKGVKKRDPLVTLLREWDILQT